MHMDRWRFYWKSKSSFPIGSWSCCFSAVYVEMLGALPKPVPQDLQLQTRCQNKNDRRHSWSWWAGCSCEHLLAGKWDETPKTTKGLTSPKNSRKKILQEWFFLHFSLLAHYFSSCFILFFSMFHHFSLFCFSLFHHVSLFFLSFFIIVRSCFSIFHIFSICFLYFS